MKPEIFARDEGLEEDLKLENFDPEPHRIEVPLLHEATEEQYRIILLDADDSFDVILQYPNGDREALWSLVR